MSMLTDAISSEAYRFSKNRMTVFWSTVFLPVVLLVLGIVVDLVMKQKVVEVSGDIHLPSVLLNPEAMDLGHSLVKLAGDLANPVLLLFVMIGTATLYAGDYRWETWRLSSARNTRANLILGKVGVAMLMTLFALILFFVFDFIGDIAKGMIQEQAFVFHFGGKEAGQMGLLALSSYLRVLQVGLLGLLAAVVTRSLLATLFVPLVVSVAQFFLMVSLPQFGWTGTEWYAQALVPGLAYDTLKGAIIGGPLSALPSSAVWAAAISLMVWCVVPIVASVVWFQRQDLSRE